MHQMTIYADTTSSDQVPALKGFEAENVPAAAEIKSN
jgi:hypothetical protein